MNRLALICVLFLTACGDSVFPKPKIVNRPTHIPAGLLRPVVVVCPDGELALAFGNCIEALRRGLNKANGQIGSIAEIVEGPQ